MGLYEVRAEAAQNRFWRYPARQADSVHLLCRTGLRFDSPVEEPMNSGLPAGVDIRAP
jgi:hypothetical protein